MNIKPFLFLASLSFSSCVNQAMLSTNPVDELYTLMAGQYDSSHQSATDSTYFNISLKMEPIWANKGHYLYVEQAMASTPTKPYRVRVYGLKQLAGNNFVSEIYMLKNEKDWIGKAVTELNSMPMNELSKKEGCEVILKRVSKNTYIGSTGNKTCSSELRGASYASSKVSITEKGMLSWDQGFNSNNEQVWGATKGGYMFDKKR